MLLRLGLLLGLFLPVSVFCQTGATWKPLEQILENLSYAADIDVELVVVHRGQTVYEKTVGFRNEAKQKPIASASKWLAGATILRLVDEGLVGLDDPVSLYLPYFRDEKAVITIRQLLTHSSGLAGDYSCLSSSNMFMDDCAKQIADRPVPLQPGVSFHYGDVSLQVAARVAEVATGQTWEDVFQSSIAVPLGMTKTTYYPNGTVRNPHAAAGAYSTSEDYVQFLQMIRNHGLWKGKRVLSERAVSLMLADQTLGAQIRLSPYTAQESWKAGAGRNRYGLSNWIEGMEDGLPDGNSSQGSFGVSPYMDRERDYFFLLFVYDQKRVYPSYYYQIQSFLNSLYTPTATPRLRTLERKSATQEDGSAISSTLTWDQYVSAPCTASGSQCPVIVTLQPAESLSKDFLALTKLHEKAEREAAVLVFPRNPDVVQEGSQTATTEESEPASATSTSHQMQQVIAVVNAMGGAFSYDPERVYLLGYRDGADLAEQLACRQPELFAGVALVHPIQKTPMTTDPADDLLPCHSRDHISVLTYQNTEPVTPATANTNGAVVSRFTYWSEKNECQDTNAWQPYSPSTLTYRDATGCWPATTVREVTSTSSSTQWPADGTDISWTFLQGKYRTSLRNGRFVTTSAADYVRRVAAPESLVSLFGADFTEETTFGDTIPLPSLLDGLVLEVQDSRGLVRNGQFAMTSPYQVNLVMPEDLAEGPASLRLKRDGETTHEDWLMVRRLRPALFSADSSGSGLPAGETLYVRADGTRWTSLLATRRSVPAGSPAFKPVPIELWRTGTKIYLTLYGTGWRRRHEEQALEVRVGNKPATVVYAGVQGQYAGLDQINIRLDDLGLEAGDHLLQVRVGGVTSNSLSIRVRTARDEEPAASLSLR